MSVGHDFFEKLVEHHYFLHFAFALLVRIGVPYFVSHWKECYMPLERLHRWNRQHSYLLITVVKNKFQCKLLVVYTCISRLWKTINGIYYIKNCLYQLLFVCLLPPFWKYNEYEPANNKDIGLRLGINRIKSWSSKNKLCFQPMNRWSSKTTLIFWWNGKQSYYLK